MTDKKQQATQLLREWKGQDYAFGLGCFDRLGDLTASLGKRASVITSGVGKPWGEPIHKATESAMAAAGVEMAGEPIAGARPNAPFEDVHRICEAVAAQSPDVVVAVGGGSGIDATKAAVAHYALAGELGGYFGVGQITEQLRAAGKTMTPIVAAQLASGSAAHLTKYSNLTDLSTGQKMLIVDEAVVPTKAVFDYRWTASMSADFTMDGALDGVSHALEVLMGASDAVLAEAQAVCLGAIDLVINNVRTAVNDPNDMAAREAVGLGTDLGGYAIMIGGTNGAHLNSFSLVDLLPHGRACALMNPYYAVFFAPAIEAKLRAVGALYAEAGYCDTDLSALSGRDLGLAVAEAMVALSREIGFPTSLAEVDGFSDAHVARCLSAAKNPKLESKLKNMPVPLTADTIDEYMGSILDAAATGDFRKIRNL